MTNPDEPRIVAVDQIDNAAVITFEGDETAVYPAHLLHAAKDLAAILNEHEQAQKGHKPAGE